MDTSFSAFHGQAIAAPTLIPELRTALSTFHSYYPNATLVAELVTTHHEQCIVRAIVKLHDYILASAMATAGQVEIAEDRAKLRAIMTLLAQHHPDVDLATFSTDRNLHASSLSSRSIQPSASHSSNLSHISPLDSLEHTGVPSSSQANPQSRDTPAAHSVVPLSSHQANLMPDLGSASSSSHTAGQSNPHVPLESVPESEHSLKSTHHEAVQSVPQAVSSLNGTDDSEKPIELIQEDEMPTNAMADEFPPSENVPALDSPQPKLSNISGAKSGTRPKSKKTSSKAKLADSTSTSESSTSASGFSQSPTIPLDLSDIIAKTSVELKRLGWSNAQGREHLQNVYGKRSRQQLTDPELIDFLEYLENQPSPSASPSA